MTGLDTIYFWVNLMGSITEVSCQLWLEHLPVAVSLFQDLEHSPIGEPAWELFFRTLCLILLSNGEANQSTFRYVAPERLNNEGFIEMINATKVRLIAIDEAHCISEWGHAFRPDYLKGSIPSPWLSQTYTDEVFSQLRGLQKRFKPKEYYA